MKTIAYVLSAFPVLSETFIGNEIRAMEALGHRTIPMVFDLRNGPAQPEDVELAQRVTRIGDIPAARALRALPGLPGALPFLYSQKLLSRRSLAWHAMKIAAHASMHGATHIHAHFAGGAAAHAIAAARLAGLPVSFTCHGHDVYAEPEDLEAKLGGADAVVAVCEDLRTDLRAVDAGARIVRIPCGTNPDRFQPRPEDAAGNGKILFVGRLVEQKGIDDLFEALWKLSGRTGIRLDIVGDGPLRQWVNDNTRSLNSTGFHKVRVLGNRDANWLASNGPHYMAACLPFKTAPDGSRDTGPLVVKEAMAMGLPVISTAFMGVKETVTPQTGILVPPGNPEALAQAIARLVALKPADRRRMGMAGRDRVRALFTLEAQARALSGMVEAA